MTAPERANRILAAYVSGSVDDLQSELQRAGNEPFSTAVRSALEIEERELLNSIALQLSSSFVNAASPPSYQNVASSFELLQHLANRSAAFSRRNGTIPAAYSSRLCELPFHDCPDTPQSRHYRGQFGLN